MGRVRVNEGEETLRSFAGRNSKVDEARIKELEAVLKFIDGQLPDAIGAETQTISAGAAYRVRTALYGAGGPRPRQEFKIDENTIFCVKIVEPIEGYMAVYGRIIPLSGDPSRFTAMRPHSAMARTREDAIAELRTKLEAQGIDVPPVMPEKADPLMTTEEGTTPVPGWTGFRNRDWS